MEIRAILVDEVRFPERLIKPGHRIRTQGTRKSQSALFEPEVIQNMATEVFFRTPRRVDVPIPDQENRLSLTDMEASGTLRYLYDYMNERYAVCCNCGNSLTKAS